MAAKFIHSYTASTINYCKIFTDNQSAIKALNAPIIRDNSVRLTALALEEAMTKTRSIKIVWTKAHVGTWGNEIADELAKQATLLDDISLQDIPLPPAEIKRVIQENINKEWLTDWTQYPLARQSKYFLPKPDPPKAKTIYELDRKTVGLTIRILSGHNALMYHRSNVDPENNSPLCRFCVEYETETFIHLITACPYFALNRLNLFLDQPVDSTGTWDIDRILDFARLTDIADALEGYFDGVHYTENLADDTTNNSQNNNQRKRRRTQTNITQYLL
jgi:hypothetical protein